MKLRNQILIVAIIFFISLLHLSAAAQENFDKSEFAARRAKVFDKISDGVAIVFANESHRYPIKFRQSPDFYYLTGIEEPNAILVLIGKTKQSIVLARRPLPSEARINGPGIFDKENPAEFYGVSQILQLDIFVYFTRRAFRDTNKVFVPLTHPDDVQKNRSEMDFEEAVWLSHPLNPTNARYKQAISKLKEFKPQLNFLDINPILDELRLVKSPYEIERMRMAGKIGAESVKEAIKATKPGMFEYELEAVANFITTKKGARGVAFTPIVPSGPNTPIFHYTKNDRQMKAGELVAMDFGADYDYYTSDVARTWAVSGKFSPEQEKMYRCIFEARNAIISAMKPGLKVSDLQDVSQKVYKKHGFEKYFTDSGRYVGHYVGISVHDVGDMEKPFVPGVVFNVEPLLRDEKLNIAVKLEDTILITNNGAENLTAGVPAEIEEIYALQK